jgi:DNA topoisomerase-1
MVIKAGKFGLLLACSAYPECENTRELETPEANAEGGDIEENCENCGKPMALKRGRFGQFLACTGYPECKTTRKIISTKQGLAAAKPDQILDEKCPKCASNLVLKQGRFGEFTACSNYPACKYVSRSRPGPVRRTAGEHRRTEIRRGKAFRLRTPDCDFTLWNCQWPRECPDATRRSWSRRSRSMRPSADLQQRGALCAARRN